MKNLLGKAFRVFIYATYPLLVIAIVALVVLLVIRSRELDSLNATFQQATTELNQETQNRELTIENLKQEFNLLNSQVATLRAENNQLRQGLERMQIDGYGAITGKLVPVITGGSDGLSQYQQVCAESVQNPNVKVCRTIAAIQQGYVLNVPVGVYRVYSEIYPNTETTTKLRAYFTEFAQCVQTGDAARCKSSEQNKPVSIEVKAGSTINNVDPVDWRV